MLEPAGQLLLLASAPLATCLCCSVVLQESSRAVGEQCSLVALLAAPLEAVLRRRGLPSACLPELTQLLLFWLTSLPSSSSYLWLVAYLGEQSSVGPCSESVLPTVCTATVSVCVYGSSVKQDCSPHCRHPPCHSSFTWALSLCQSSTSNGLTSASLDLRSVKPSSSQVSSPSSLTSARLKSIGACSIESATHRCQAAKHDTLISKVYPRPSIRVLIFSSHFNSSPSLPFRLHPIVPESVPAKRNVYERYALSVRASN